MSIEVCFVGWLPQGWSSGVFFRKVEELKRNYERPRASAEVHLEAGFTLIDRNYASVILKPLALGRKASRGSRKGTIRWLRCSLL